jgi:hypothetical protein
MVDPTVKAAYLNDILLSNLNDLAGWVVAAPFAWSQE